MAPSFLSSAKALSTLVNILAVQTGDFCNLAGIHGGAEFTHGFQYLLFHVFMILKCDYLSGVLDPMTRKAPRRATIAIIIQANTKKSLHDMALPNASMAKG